MLAEQVVQDLEKESAGQRRSFVDSHGWKSARIEAMPADASFRRYFRLQGGPKPALLMDCSKDPESIEDFIKIACHLKKLGVSAPQIYASDLQQRYAIIEDFGDDTFTRLLDAGADPRPLYEGAVDVLSHLHSQPDNAKIDLGHYDEKQLLDREAALLPDWYFPAITGRAPTAAERADYFDVWRGILSALPPAQEVMVLRDYHVDNLMRIPGRSGVDACGVLDFQIGLIGSNTYDLAALLQDARRDVPADLAEAMIKRYLAAVPGLDKDSFHQWYPVLAAQRHAKILGIFVRLCARDNKPRYLKFIPRVARLMQVSLQAAPLAPLKNWMEKTGVDLSRPVVQPLNIVGKDA